MPEVPMSSSISVRNCASAADVADATTLLLETRRGARVKLVDGSQATFTIYESDGAGEWNPSLDDTGNPVTVTIYPGGWRPLPCDLFLGGWIRFVGAVAQIRAKVLG